MHDFRIGETVYIPAPLEKNYYLKIRYTEKLRLGNERHLVFRHPLTARVVGEQMANVFKIK